MAFEFRAERENFRPVQRTSHKRIERMKHAESHSDAAPKPTRGRDVAVNGAGKRQRFALNRLEIFPRRLPRHRHGLALIGLGDGDVVIDLQGHSEAVKTRSEIRSGGRHAHRDLLLFQRNSPDTAGGEVMSEANLMRPFAAATTRDVRS